MKPVGPERADRRGRLESARLYLVCDGRSDRFLNAALGGGVDIVQLRLKDADDREIVETGRRFSRTCAAHGALFILNDRPELVSQVGADGAHVGQDDMSVEQARSLLGPDRLIGLSTHSRAQIEAAGERGADYIGVGPVYETATKPGRDAVGLDLVRYASEHARVAFFAIGGIDRDTVQEVVAAGARRIAVVRALVNAAQPGTTARDLRHAVQMRGERVGAAQS